ncbi:hypothetical protein VTN49DRAFT_4902 [Thermomyces lanuginosus]|uniref:uncharacterized protein n=1 Tax=Thermomyces lanuginosus TaxID=5541 RepID=UPI003744A4FA
MPRLSPSSEKAIARLRAFGAPTTNYYAVPLSRRAAVLILLYADRRGDLRVVLTIRAKTLSSYAGHAAFPGGKADSLEETPFQTARREAAEEIGLPNIGEPLIPPFRVEHLCELPANLAKTELVVRPCVAFLHSYDPVTGKDADPEVSLIPRLDAKEVAAVFTAPFHNFLLGRDERPLDVGEDDGQPQLQSEPPAGVWYQGSWTTWHQTDWRMHHFYVPISESNVTKPKTDRKDQTAAVDQLEKREKSGELTRYRVFGMTARILVDAARLAYDEEPEFEHNSHFGDEDMIAKLLRLGRLKAERRPDDELTRETMQKAAKLS